MREAGIEDPYEIEKIRALGVIDLPTIQKKANLHFSLSLDLFGSEVSTNAANAFNAGLKGRFQEERIDDDHQLVNDTYPVLKLVDGEIRMVDEPALSALNMRLRDDYVRDCQGGINRWNRLITKAGIDFEIKLPNVAFHRHIGEFRNVHTTPDGKLLSDAEWGARRDEFLPNLEDGDYIASLMSPVREPGQFASWISAPRVGIDNKPGDFEYVKIHD
jgi:benzoyl-CoA 2,3-dioxygenase component B